MQILYELRVVPTHRYDQLPIRLKNGDKAWVGKNKVTIVGSDILAEGEEFTIQRYAEEGRMTVVVAEPEASEKPKPKKVRDKKFDIDDLEV